MPTPKTTRGQPPPQGGNKPGSGQPNTPKPAPKPAPRPGNEDA